MSDQEKASPAAVEENVDTQGEYVDVGDAAAENPESRTKSYTSAVNDATAPPSLDDAGIAAAPAKAEEAARAEPSSPAPATASDELVPRAKSPKKKKTMTQSRDFLAVYMWTVEKCCEEYKTNF
jgi:hypothetical protein